MRFDVISIFPQLILESFNFGITGRALRDGLVDLKTWDIREFSENRTKRVDDRPYSGGPGMLMQVEPLMNAINAAKKDSHELSHVIYMSSQGPRLTQDRINKLSTLPHLIILAGRYEGIDERVIENGVDEEISIGDFVVSGGEIPALLLMDSITRELEGALGDSRSNKQESFKDGLIEYPQYSRPEKSSFGNVPPVLLGGDPKEINRWKLKYSLLKTLRNRPDLMAERDFSPLELELLNEIKDEDKY